MKWSSREDLVLGRTLKHLVVIINMYKNRHGKVAILISIFGGCSEGYSWRIRWWVTPRMAPNLVKDLVPPHQQEC
jgi:hypothetical protein